MKPVRAAPQERQPLSNCSSLKLVKYTIFFHIPLCVKERGSEERKRRLAPRLSPYQSILTSHTLPASSHAFANALQAASRSKNVKLSFRKKAGRQLHVFANLFPPPSDRSSALSTAPYPAPAPCRTQGVRGAADTPPRVFPAAGRRGQARVMTAAMRAASAGS